MLLTIIALAVFIAGAFSLAMGQIIPAIGCAILYVILVLIMNQVDDEDDI